MQWRGRRQSGNVDDQRGRSGAGGMAFKGGIGTLAIVLVQISLILGKNPLSLITGDADTVGSGRLQSKRTINLLPKRRSWVSL